MEKTLGNHVADMTSALAGLDASPGSHNIVEILGGKGGCTQIAIRRKLRAGPNMDIVCGLDLTIPEQQKSFVAVFG